MSTSWKRALLMAFSVAGGAGVLALLASGLGRDARAIISPLPGRPAPDFALEVLLGPRPPVGTAPQPGDSVQLNALRGEVVVINFWASWCLACRQEHAALSRVAQRYRDRGVFFFGILYQDTRANADRFIDEMGGQAYPTLLDPGSHTAINFGLYGVPETYVIGRDGIVLHKQIGPVTEDGLAGHIETALGAVVWSAGSSQDTPLVTLYKNPTCACCLEWAKYMRANGFRVDVKEGTNLAEVREELGVPFRLASCHTAVVDGYAIEGHVPADLVRKLLAERPQVTGLAVPSMPPGVPGMPDPGPGRAPYDILAIRKDGSTHVYATR